MIDEYLLALHPALITNGPQIFAGLTTDLALRLVDAKVFDGGCVLLRYAAIGRP